jgi:alcohol dehydrogenase class IV
VRLTVKQSPTLKEVDELQEKAKGDIILGVGGGGAMDAAKRIGANLSIPKITVPTNYGCSSEMNDTAILIVDGKKKLFTDRKYLPEVALIDPELTEPLDRRTSIVAGLATFSRAIESRQAKMSNDLTKMFVNRGIELILHELNGSIEGEPFPRLHVVYATTLVNIAASNTGTTMCSILAYPLENRGVAHQEAVAHMFPHVMAHYMDKYIKNGTQVQYSQIQAFIKPLLFESRVDPAKVKASADELVKEALTYGQNTLLGKLESRTMAKIYKEAFPGI